MKVYVVRGSRGSHEDYVFWEVAAFINKERADNLCESLNTWCREHEVSSLQHVVITDVDMALKCPLDPNFSVGYDGTWYEVWSIEIKEDLVVPTLVRAVKMAKNWIEHSGKEPASNRADVLYAINTALAMINDAGHMD